jgi:hypothetical protein
MILNLTPHDVVVYADADTTFDAATRKRRLNPGATPVATFPKSGTVAQVVYQDDPFFLGAIPVARKRVVRVDGVDDIHDGIIVSAQAYQGLVACGHGQMNDVFSVGDTIVDADGKIVGCTGLRQG